MAKGGYLTLRFTQITSKTVGSTYRLLSLKVQALP